MTVGSAFLWRSGMVMVFDEAGAQMPHLQGKASPELLERIRSESTPDTEWFGFDETGPLDWVAFVQSSHRRGGIR